MAAATSRGICARSGSINVYCTMAAGAIMSAGAMPAKKTTAPSLLSICTATFHEGR